MTSPPRQNPQRQLGAGESNANPAVVCKVRHVLQHSHKGHKFRMVRRKSNVSAQIDIKIIEENLQSKSDYKIKPPKKLKQHQGNLSTLILENVKSLASPQHATTSSHEGLLVQGSIPTPGEPKRLS